MITKHPLKTQRTSTLLTPLCRAPVLSDQQILQIIHGYDVDKTGFGKTEAEGA